MMTISQRMAPTAEDRERRGAVALFVLGAVFFLLAIITTPGCVPVEAIAQAKKEQSINLGHSNDTGLPQPARDVGTDNYDAWSAQRYALEGKRLPEAVADRLEARGQLPEGYAR